MSVLVSDQLHVEQPSGTDRRVGMRTIGISVVAFALLAGCLEQLEPDVGPPIRDVCRDVDSDPAVDVSFAQDILTGIFALDGRGCHQCHLPNGETPIGVEIGGLDLTNYSTLRQGGIVSGADIVVAQRPCDSILWQKVTAGPPFGARMPASGPPHLSPEEIKLINDWIAEGALDN